MGLSIKAHVRSGFQRHVNTQIKLCSIPRRTLRTFCSTNQARFDTLVILQSGESNSDLKYLRNVFLDLPNDIGFRLVATVRAFAVAAGTNLAVHLFKTLATFPNVPSFSVWDHLN